MIDMNEIRKEIKKLECGPTTFSNCEKLAMLYTICDHAKGLEMAEAYERREDAREKAEANKSRWVEPEYHASYAVRDFVNPINMTMAEEWMEGLHNEDGTRGAHWTMDQVKQVMAQKGVKGDPLEYWVILNSLYSDYCGVLKKHNANNIDVYVDMAKAWIEDKDAQEGKTARYFQYITK